MRLTFYNQRTFLIYFLIFNNFDANNVFTKNEKKSRFRNFDDD